jgi:precorrin-2 dehydrogenase/sirohydrochlorin ferrochelatase
VEKEEARPETQPVTYPVNLCLENMPVLVVGGGKVALRKVKGLLRAGAIVTVVAPEVESALVEMAGDGRLELFRRKYETGEATAYRLVFSATGDERVDWQVSYDAALGNVFVNVADVPERCTFYLPAVVRRGRLQVSINSDGSAPFASRRLRERLEELIGEEFTSWLDAAGAFRQAVLEGVADPARREELFDRYFAETWPVLGKDTPPQTPAESVWRGWIAAATKDG